MGNPTASSAEGKFKKPEGKLSGSYQFPFLFPFPALVDLECFSRSCEPPTQKESHCEDRRRLRGFSAVYVYLSRSSVVFM
ncbi:hypothetical protein BDZ97DRAFT_1822182 [Flammula alnicola]|nr:hypothetical protein BDZ97DRAFT_1822182 [Flammula alnicola]